MDEEVAEIIEAMDEMCQNDVEDDSDGDGEEGDCLDDSSCDEDSEQGEDEDGEEATPTIKRKAAQMEEFEFEFVTTSIYPVDRSGRCYGMTSRFDGPRAPDYNLVIIYGHTEQTQDWF